MSYDLYLVPKDDDPAAAYERLEQEAEREPTPEEEVRLRQLAADLQVANSGLDISEPDSGFLLQLGYDTERPVVIDISAGEITMSWSYGADEPGPALEEVRRYLPVFDRHGLVAYDPQLEQVFDPDRDAHAVAETHEYVRERTFEKYGVASHQPWWKRIFSR
jgi:hypothetical protein